MSGKAGKNLIVLAAVVVAVVCWAREASAADCASGFYKCSEGALGPVCDPIPSDCASGGTGTLRASCNAGEIPGSKICSGAITCCVPISPDCDSVGGSCKASCGSGEIEETPSDCTGGDVCCVPEDDNDGYPGEGDKCKKGFQEYAGVCFPMNTGLSEKPVMEIVSNFLMWLLGIFGFIAIIAFIISGIQYLTSAGDEKAIETAKRNMRWSLVGVVVALSGLVIIYAVDAALKASPTYF